MTNMSDSKHKPVDSSELPDYYGSPTHIVRKRSGRNVVLGVDRTTNKHGIESGCRIVVSSSTISGYGTVKRVLEGEAGFDGGAQLLVDFDKNDEDNGWIRVPLIGCRLKQKREENIADN